MTFSEKALVCVECGKSFAFTTGEQEFFAARGYTNEPKRCPDCREVRRTQQRGSRGPREMHEVTCAQCGTQTTVPFKPRGDKPVYCSDCFAAVKPVSTR